MIDYSSILTDEEYKFLVRIAGKKKIMKIVEVTKFVVDELEPQECCAVASIIMYLLNLHYASCTDIEILSQIRTSADTLLNTFVEFHREKRKKKIFDKNGNVIN